MKKVTIIGAGKLARNIIKGLLASGLTPSDIDVCGRKTTDFSKVLELGVATHTSLTSLLIEDRVIILCVQPKHIGVVSVEITSVIRTYIQKHRHHPEYELTSVVSGLSINTLAENSLLAHNKILVTTMDTNVAIGKGIIRYQHSDNAKVSDSLALLKRLGAIEKVSDYRSVLKSVTVLGAGKALDLTVIKLLYKQSSVYSVKAFIQKLDECFTTHSVATTAFLGWHLDLGNNVDAMLKQYLHQKGKAIVSVFGPDQKAFFIGVEAFANTIASLAKEETLDENTFDAHIKDIATQGGCTEKGLGLVTTIGDVTKDNLDRKLRKKKSPFFREDKKENKIHGFFSKVHHRTLGFKRDLQRSYVETPKVKYDVVLAALAKSEYPLG